MPNRNVQGFLPDLSRSVTHQEAKCIERQRLVYIRWNSMERKVKHLERREQIVPRLVADEKSAKNRVYPPPPSTAGRYVGMKVEPIVRGAELAVWPSWF